MTGLRFHISGNCASLGNSHQYTCLILGAARSVGATLGGFSHMISILADTGAATLPQSPGRRRFREAGVDVEGLEAGACQDEDQFAAGDLR